MFKPSRLGHTWALTHRLAVGLCALLILGGIVLSYAAFAYGRVAAQDAFDRVLVGAANTIAANISISDGELVVELPRSAFELLALAPQDRIAYQVRGVQGELITGYDLELRATRDLSSDENPLFFDATFSDEPARFVRTHRQFAERRLTGTVEVIVGQTLLARNELAFDIARRALIGLILGGVAVLGLTIFVVRSALRPLDDIAVSIRNRDPQDLTQIDQAAPREIGVLLASLNGFMVRLDQQFEVMRNLISDTAHQLRTPVAALRAQSDLAQQETDIEKRQELITKMHRRSLSLGRLLDQMLARAMVIHRLESARREAVDLRDIALSLIDEGDFEALFPDQDIKLSIGPDPVRVRADRVSIEEAVKNLLSNACQHGMSPIVLGVDQLGDRARIWVRDAGQGPSPAILASIGDRFMRSSVARGTSSGLGMSIAQSVAAAFGGQLRMEQTDLGFYAGLEIPNMGQKYD